MPTRIPRNLLFGVLALLGAAALPLWPGSDVAAQGRSPQVIQTQCRTCHADKFGSTAASPHSVLDDPEWREEYGVSLSCTACHGDVNEHISAGGQAPVFNFQTQPASEQNAVCMGCHRDTHPQFDSSPHARAGQACTSCHSQHAAGDGNAHLLKAAPTNGLHADLGMPSALCADCHADIASLFGLNEHHRLGEGIVECTSCHNPHEPATRTALGGFKQQACTTCHEDKGGPFVFEHPASRVEGCTACHTPHGSPNRHLLATPRVAELCISCHAEVPQFHLGFSPAGPSRFNLDTQCTNCHSQIHGSNFHPRFLR